MHRRVTSCQNILANLPRRACFKDSQHCHYSSAPKTKTKTKPRPPPRVVDPQADAAQKLTRLLIDHTARQTTGWSSLKVHRGLEKELKKKVISRAPSFEKAAFEAISDDWDEGLEDDMRNVLTPGTFVEMRRSEIPANGILISEIIKDGRLRYVVIVPSGELWIPAREDITFSIPSFVPADLAARARDDGPDGIPGEPTIHVIHARAELLKRLREMEKTLEEQYSTVRLQCKPVYNLVKSSDPDKWASVTLDQVVQIVSPGKPTSSIGNLVIQKFLLDHPLYFVASSSFDIAPSFNVRPQARVDEILNVQKWTRLSAKDSPISSFSQKAREVMEREEKLYNESHEEGPSQSRGAHTWSPTDKVILSFLLHSLRPRRSNQGDPYSIAQSAVIKSITGKMNDVTDALVHKTVISLGVLAPWQDLSYLDPELRLELVQEADSLLVREKDALVTKAYSSPPKQGPLGPEDFHPTDPLESVRHDFGDMPVYVIDSADAEELDDGISIERIPSEPGSFRIHVHVADPAAVIPINHVFAKDAAKQGSTIYASHRTWRLFPVSLMKSPSHGLSLGARVGHPTRVLTFSAKVDSLGVSSDFKVRAGIVNNIITTTYDAVDTAICGSPPPMTYPFGGQPSLPIFPPYPESQFADLKDLTLVGENLAAKRFRDEVFIVTGSGADVVQSTRHPDISSPTLEPSSFRGFPTLTYAVSPQSHSDTGAHGTVAEMMKLAAKTASAFFLERGLPALRRCAEAPPIAPAILQEVLDNRLPNCHVPADTVRHLNVAISSPAHYSLEPKGHFGLGIFQGEGYVRSTSPLRRYGDLVAHWQLHHALLGSAAPSSRPPFDESMLLGLAQTFAIQDKMVKSLQRNQTKYLQAMFIKRWMEDTARGVERPIDPLRDLKGYVVTTPRLASGTRFMSCVVTVPSLGLRCYLENIANRDVVLKSDVEVTVKEILMGSRPKVHVALQ